jgi:hypothetical protein
MRARRFATALVVMSSIVGLGWTDAAGAATGPEVRGAGTITLPAVFGDLAGDRVIFQVHAAGSGPTARGRFTVTHLDDAGGLYGRVEGDITCMTVDGKVAVTTGSIRHAWFRDFPGSAVVGDAVAITVADNGLVDTLGFDFEFFPSMIVPCGAVGSFVKVERGNFIVR